MMSLLALNILGGILIAAVFAGLVTTVAKEIGWKGSSMVFGIAFSSAAVLLLGACLLTLES